MLAALLLVNLIFTDHFFQIEIKDGHLYGSLIDIFRFGAPLILVALGMTLVIATSGIDLSVGSGGGDLRGAGLPADQLLTYQDSIGGVLGAVGIALGLAVALGVGNGVLVAVIGIQPIIATLILMVAGRGLAQLITDGQIITINSDPVQAHRRRLLADRCRSASSSSPPCWR